jgi:glycosyltransferase involved in cell wall biosynthesis
MSIKLSIFIPIYNESAYIEQCVASLQSNKTQEYEVIISDNYSDDGTYEMLQSVSDNRFKIVRPPKKLTPQKHHWFAFNQCKGEYVFFIGGDDYFEGGIIDRVLPTLQNDIICIGQMRCFDDQTGDTLEISNESDFLRNNILFDGNFIKNYLNQISHDEIMYAFMPKRFLKNAQLMLANSLETLLPWMGFLAFTHNIIVNKMVYLDEVIFHKRYNKLYLGAGNFTKDAYNSSFAKLFTLKSINSLINCFIYFYQTKNIRGFFTLIFYNRSMERPQTHRGGFLGNGNYGKRRWYFGPFIMLFTAFFIDIFIYMRFLYRKKYKP